MSFEVFLLCFGESEPAGIPRDAVRSLFPVIAEESKPDCWRVRYDDKNSCDIYPTVDKSNEKMLKSLMVHRPCGDLRLWDALLSVLRMGSVVMLWPGGPPVVADEIVASSLPRDVTDSKIGPPRSVCSGDEILRLIRES